MHMRSRKNYDTDSNYTASPGIHDHRRPLLHESQAHHSSSSKKRSNRYSSWLSSPPPTHRSHRVRLQKISPNNPKALPGLAGRGRLLYRHRPYHRIEWEKWRFRVGFNWREGLTQSPRTEDIPVVPVETAQVHLKPYNFALFNPMNDVPGRGRRVIRVMYQAPKEEVGH